MKPYEILLIAAVAFLALLYAYAKTPRGRGWVGETRVKWVIKKTKPGIRYVINDLRISAENGKTSQIDHVLICRNGIFVIETKNYSGRIYGNDNQLEWTQVLNYGRVKNKLYSPIKQNKTHIYHVSKALSEKLPIVSAVVFVQGNIRYIDSYDVYDLKGLKHLINTNYNTLTPEQMKRAYEDLLNANDSSVSTYQHIKNIQYMRENVSKNVCPRCGGKLIERQGKNGGFMGCSNYPKCRFTKQL